MAKEIRYVVGGSEEVAKTFRVIALPKAWMTDPWSQLEEGEHPDRWDDLLPILVVPEEVDKIGASDQVAHLFADPWSATARPQRSTR